MNFKTTVLLVALLVIVVAVWLFFPSAERRDGDSAPPPPTTDELESVFASPPQDDQLVRVALERAGKPRLVFERVATDTAGPGPGEWRMTEPLAVPADSSKLLGLVRTVANLQARSTARPGAASTLTAKDAGLEPPTAPVTRTDKDGKPYTLEVGQKVVMSSDTYVRVGGEQDIRVAARDLRPQVDKEPRDFRLQQLIRFKPDEATHVQVEHAGQTYQFSRGADNQWVIDQPLRAQAESAKLREKLLTPLSTLQAADYVDESPATQAVYGFDEPFMTVTVTTEQKRPKPAPATQPDGDAQPEPEVITQTQRLVIGGAADLKSERRYVQTDAGPWVAIVAQTNIANLVPKLSELRDPRITRVKATDITQLELTTGETTTVLKKENGVWQGTGDLATVDPEAVNDVLTAFAELAAINYVDDPQELGQYGLATPRAVLTASVAGAVAPITVRVGSESASGRNAYVQREGEPGVMVITEAVAARLAVTPLTLRSRAVFSFPPEQVQSVAVTRGPGRTALTRAAGVWQLTEPADAPLDAGNVQNLVNDLSRLRAKRVVSRGDAAKYGLEEPGLTIQFALAAAPADSQPSSAPAEALEEHVLRVALQDKVAYACKDDDPFVFELDETVYRVLTAELIDPRLFTFKPEAIVGVKVVATGGTLELAKVGDVWKYAPDPYVELNQKKVQDFAKELTQMRAETYTAYRDGDLAAAGLVDAPATVTIRLADGGETVIKMAQPRPGELPRLAALVAEQRIFLMRPADCEKLLRGLDEYVKSDKPESPEMPASPGMPGQPGMPGPAGRPVLPQ
jgi:hypothetical protein